MLGLWDGVWSAPFNPGTRCDLPPYTTRDETTYRAAAEWLDAVCDRVEDWGCGDAYAKRFFTRATYRGVDGSRGPADVIADLQGYRSDTDGILLRHVLEHNRNWRIVLDNALRSAWKRVAIVLFTPFSETTRELFVGRGIPDIGFSRDDLYAALAGWSVAETAHATELTVYGAETVLYAEKM